MEISIKIQVSDSESDVCGDNCPFLEYDTCLLFSKELNDTILPDNFEWQGSPTKDRCFQCFGID